MTSMLVVDLIIRMVDCHPFAMKGEEEAQKGIQGHPTVLRTTLVSVATEAGAGPQNHHEDALLHHEGALLLHEDVRLHHSSRFDVPAPLLEHSVVGDLVLTHLVLTERYTLLRLFLLTGMLLPCRSPEARTRKLKHHAPRVHRGPPYARDRPSPPPYRGGPRRASPPRSPPRANRAFPPPPPIFPLRRAREGPRVGAQAGARHLSRGPRYP